MKPLVALVLTTSLAAVAGIAFAQLKMGAAPAPASDAVLRAAVLKAIPGVKIESVNPSVIPGYREVAISGKVVYVSVDGKYLMQGSLVELSTRDNLTAASEGVLRRGTLNAVGPERRIVFGPANPKHRVTVFTDIDCGYCRKLHSEMADFNKAGIAIEYLFFPRAGVGSESFQDAVSVWCSADRRKALTDAKAGKPTPKKTCANPVAEDYELGRRIGVDGTPAIYAADGTQIGGYLSPQDMLQRLDRIAAKAR